MVDFINRFFKGEFNDNPIVKRIYNMVEGKSDSDKFKILVNMLQSQGFDINQKIFSEADLKRWGIPIPDQK